MAFKKTGSVTSTEFNEGYSNLTVVGSPTISDDGIASGFSSSNYFKLPLLATPTSSYEITVKFNITTFDDGRVLGNSTTNVHSPQLESPASSETKLWYGHPSSSYSWITLTPSVTVSTGTWYWFNVVWDGSTVTTKLSTDGSTWTSGGSVSATTCGWNEYLEIGADQGGAAFSGSIDLKALFVKINGSPVYSPAPNKFTTSSYQTTSRNIYEV